MPAAPAEPVPDFERLLDYLRTHRGADFTGYKRPSLMRLVQRRMAAAGFTDYAAYQDHLEVDPGELAALLDSLLINVTKFFRDRDSWDALAQLLPERLAQTAPDAPV